MSKEIKCPECGSLKWEYDFSFPITDINPPMYTVWYQVECKDCEITSLLKELYCWEKKIQIYR